jgi:ubiquinone/menaquinone biosynthesis C-methylase UbiE
MTTDIRIEGSVDHLTSTEIHGWAYRTDDPSEYLTVTVQLKGVDIGSGSANQFRSDLHTGKIGDGDHAYFLTLPQPVASVELEDIVVFASTQDGRRANLTPSRPDTPATAPESAPQAEPAERAQPMEEPAAELVAPTPPPAVPAYAESAPLLPPVGFPVDFLDDTVLSEFAIAKKIEPTELRDRLRRDVFAIPHPVNREGYAEGFDLDFWLSGYADYETLRKLAAERGVTRGRYFDFGGSTGRVFRHFALQTDAWDVWSCDFKPSSVEFNLKYFPKSIRAFLNTAYPALPIPDGYFDLISACSVFTHIDETETGWLLELRRVLKVGGIACLSIHSKETWLAMEGELRADVERFRPDIASRPVLPEGKTVVTFRSDDPYRCQTFHSDAYIERNWGRYFEICEIRPLVLGLQAFVVMRRVD